MGSTGRRAKDGGGACRIISLRGRETSWWTLRLTVVGPDWANRGRANNSNRLAASAERWAVALLCLYIDKPPGLGKTSATFFLLSRRAFPAGWRASPQQRALGDVTTSQNSWHSNHVLNVLLRIILLYGKTEYFPKKGRAGRSVGECADGECELVARALLPAKCRRHIKKPKFSYSFNLWTLTPGKL
jgi:hypothetical protein